MLLRGRAREILKFQKKQIPNSIKKIERGIPITTGWGIKPEKIKLKNCFQVIICQCKKTTNFPSKTVGLAS
jgi:hypothetical protein